MSDPLLAFQQCQNPETSPNSAHKDLSEWAMQTHKKRLRSTRDFLEAPELIYFTADPHKGKADKLEAYFVSTLKQFLVEA